MSKRKIQEHKEKSWNPLKSYQKVCNTINAWPNWKKWHIMRCSRSLLMLKN